MIKSSLQQLIMATMLLCFYGNAWGLSGSAESSYAITIDYPAGWLLYDANAGIEETVAINYQDVAYQGGAGLFQTDKDLYYGSWKDVEYTSVKKGLSENGGSRDKSFFDDLAAEFNSTIPPEASKPTIMLIFGAGLAILASVARRRKNGRE